MIESPAPRTGAAIRTGPLRAARTILAEADAGGTDERGRALTRIAVGHLLRQDGLRGLSHPTDPRLVRPGILGAAVGVVVAAVFCGISLLVVGSIDAGPLGGPQVGEGSGDPFADPFGGPVPADSDWTMGWSDHGAATDGGSEVLGWVATGFVVLGALLVLAALVALTVRLASVARGTLLVRRGRAVLAGLPGSAGGADPAAEHEALDAAYPRFAGMLSWTLPRTRSRGLSHHHRHHDHHDPFDHHDDPHDPHD